MSSQFVKNKNGYKGVPLVESGCHENKVTLKLRRCLYTLLLVLVSFIATIAVMVSVFTAAFYSPTFNADSHITTTHSSLQTAGNSTKTTNHTTTQTPLPIGLTLNLPYKPHTCLALLNYKDQIARINSTERANISFKDSNLPQLKVSLRRSGEHRVPGCCTNYHSYRFQVRLPNSMKSTSELYLISKCGEPVTVTSLNSSDTNSLRDVYENTLFLTHSSQNSKFLRLRSFMNFEREIDDYGCYLISSSNQLITSNKDRFLDDEILHLGSYLVESMYDFKFVEVECEENAELLE